MQILEDAVDEFLPAAGLVKVLDPEEELAPGLPGPLMADDERLLTVHDIAERFQVPASWVYARAECRDLPSVKIGKYLRFEKLAIEAWFDKQRQGGASK